MTTRKVIMIRIRSIIIMVGFRKKEIFCTLKKSLKLMYITKLSMRSGLVSLGSLIK